MNAETEMAGADRLGTAPPNHAERLRRLRELIGTAPPNHAERLRRLRELIGTAPPPSRWTEGTG